MDITGPNGQKLKEKFAAVPRTYMGITTAGFPNLFTVNAASVGNFVRASEPLIDWVAMRWPIFETTILGASRPLSRLKTPG